ncbi:TPA: hypothetical protein QEL15_002040 [Stenotrophomonas maltophilia]|nr:hypothetical protein [Stenotrophomonas maltophilia]
MDKPTYSWSADEEYWHGPFVSIEAAMQDAFESCDVDVTGVSVGVTDTIDTGALFSASNFCELVQERLSDEIGEGGDDFLCSATPEQLAELDKFLAAWVAKVEPGDYFRVDRWDSHLFTDHGLVREGK